MDRKAEVKYASALSIIFEMCIRDSQNNIQIDLDLLEKEGDRYFRTSESVQERAYTQQELEQVLKKAGLKIEAIYHEDSLQPPMETSQRLIYVTTKENQK